MTPPIRLAFDLGAALLLATAPAAHAMSQTIIHSEHEHHHHSDAAQTSSVTVENAWSRATAPSQQVGAAFLTLRNGGNALDRLIGAQSSAASTLELHSVTMSGGVMRMRPVDSVSVPAGETVALKPGGLHIMMIGLTAPLKQESWFDLTLVFERGGTVTVPVHVGPANGVGHRVQRKTRHKH